MRLAVDVPVCPVLLAALLDANLPQLGDVWAHLGDWPQAQQAWSSALDALLGPYQVASRCRQ
jgi:hypothetical protein